MTRATVVIPNWNGMEHLPECLGSLREQTFTDFEVILVDNASSDGSVDYVRTAFPEVRIVALHSNLGFPGAVNAGIRASCGEYVILLNNDTRAEPNWLERLIRAMDDHPEFAFGSSKLLRHHEPELIDSCGHTYSLWIGAGDNVGEEEPAWRYGELAWVFGACAAGAIYRRELFEDIGLYDEDFFFTHEDVEFDLRANVAGYRCLFVPDAIVYHKRGASYDITPELHLAGVRNRIWAAGKNLPPLALALWVAGKILRVGWWVPARFLGFTPRRRVPPHRAGGTSWRNVPVGDALRAAFGALRRLATKRRQVASVRRLGSVALLRSLWRTRAPRPLDPRHPKAEASGG